MLMLQFDNVYVLIKAMAANKAHWSSQTLDPLFGIHTLQFSLDAPGCVQGK